MTRDVDALQTRLTVLRNLSVSSFSSLANIPGSRREPAIKEQFPDVVTWGRVNGAMVNIRNRFESYRTLVNTLSSAAGSDGAIALAQSMISHIGMVSEWLKGAGVEELSHPYSKQADPIIDWSLEQLLKEGDSVRGATAILYARPSALFPSIPALPCYWYCLKLAMRYAAALQLKHTNGLSNIVREINFPPEYQQAGLAILNYFSAILADKYPDIPVAVSIKQEPNLVTLVITLPDGTEDIIAKALNDYGLVVTGQMTAKEFVKDDLKVLALEQKLELAALEIRQSREILRIQDQYSEKRIGTLEAEVKNLYTLLGREFTSREKLQEGFVQLSESLVQTSGNAGTQLTTLLAALSQAISDRNAESTKIILEDIQAASPDLFDQLGEFFLNAATSGVIGNAVYDWIKVFLPLVPK